MGENMTRSTRSIRHAKITGGKRLDIQGLRALAVLMVVADHLLAKLIPGFPGGGFVGVDVFFVISGFLITGILLKEHDRTGRIGFVGFYKRRAKRILPAALATLALTAALANLILPTGRAREVWWDTLFSTLFLANYRFAAAGTDYFQSSAPPSPLQHFWSLAVEEQFYFVWPWLMLLIFVVIGRKASGDVRLAHNAAGVAMAVIVIASFAWAMVETTTQPTWAYFDTLSRTWELGVGALLAVGASHLGRIPERLRPTLAWLGFAGIILSIFLINDESAFPAPWGLLPVLATALVVAAGTGGPATGLWPLENKFSQYVGDMSYSLYLVHFPVIILGSALMGDSSLYIPVVLCLTAAAGILFYEFVEPIPSFASNSWGRLGKKQALDWGSDRKRFAGLAVLGLVTAAAVPVALFGQSIFNPPPAPSAVVAPLANTATQAPKAGLAGKIDAALAASAWPDLRPSIYDAATDKAPHMEGTAKCMHPGNYADSSLCTYGDLSASKTAVIIGDSIAVSWMPALVPALTSEGYKVRAIGLGSCPFIAADITLEGKPDETARCNDSHDRIPGLVQAIAPDLLILSNQEGAVESLGKGDEGAAKWVESRKAAIAQVSAEGRQIAILTPPPAGKDPQTCATKVSTPASCVAEIRLIWRQMHDAEKATAEAVGARFVDTSPWFCSDRGMCPAFIGDAPVRLDMLHVTETYAATLVEPMRSGLLGLPRG